MEREKDLFSGRTFDPEAGVAGDVLVIGHGAYQGTFGAEDRPAREVVFGLFFEIIGKNGSSGELVGVLQGTDTGEAYQRAVHTPLGERLKIKGNR